MRRYYVDNVRWVTVVIVVIYHVLYMYNTEGILGGLGRITDLSVQYYDIFMYLVYPWFMPVLFIAAGMSSRYFLDGHSDREFVKNRTRKLLVPSTIGLIAFQFIQGYVNLSLGGAFADLAASGVPGPVIFLIMLASGSGVLWFIHLLWIYSMLLVLVRKIEKGRILKLGAGTPLWLILLFFISCCSSFRSGERGSSSTRRSCRCTGSGSILPSSSRDTMSFQTTRSWKGSRDALRC